METGQPFQRSTAFPHHFTEMAFVCCLLIAESFIRFVSFTVYPLFFLSEKDAFRI